MLRFEPRWTAHPYFNKAFRNYCLRSPNGTETTPRPTSEIGPPEDNLVNYFLIIVVAIDVSVTLEQLKC